MRVRVLLLICRMWASELSRAGAGAKPAGVTPVATTIPINCTNKDIDAVMTLVFDGNISATRDTNGKQSIIQAQDNPDVGIMIMDSQQNSVDLNAGNISRRSVQIGGKPGCFCTNC